MTYTADMNYTLTLESGNWMTGFIANIEKREVTFTYHDRRRAGQIARTYTVKFAEDLSTVEDIVAVSARAGRIEHFKSTVARDVCANIIRRAKMVEFEQKLEEECEPKVEAKEITFPVFFGLFILLAVIMVVSFVACLVIPEGNDLYELCRTAFFGSGLGSLASAFIAMYTEQRE